MARLKIISDPYQKTIHFYVQDPQTQEYTEINETSSPHSRLLNEKIVHGFFPFHSQEVTDILYSEYHTGEEKLEIEFTGTDDEYAELQNSCSANEHAGDFVLTRGDKRKESADVILPKISTIFNEKICPLIEEGVSDEHRESIEKEIEKFRDASADVIPICVMGSYSVGKSTFINALIGMEVLPNGTEPLTARIVRISQSDAPDHASITFTYGNQPMEIIFDGDSYAFRQSILDCSLEQTLRTALDEMAGKSPVDRIRRAMEILNGDSETISAEKEARKEESAGEPQEQAEPAKEEDTQVKDEISEEIRLCVPFRGPIWKETRRHFVIFDTPGANSASHTDHLKVLQNALKGFSNGLPIFVTGKKELDTKDNENLQKTFHDMSELDDRFTMIVVNRADEESFPKDGWSRPMIKRILSQSIPRALYSGGIYYVSSVIGLGAKTGGIFPEGDEDSQKIFDEHRESFENPESRYYTRLYVENILPVQMKREADASAKKQTNLLYANSGLYSIERAISLFAVRFSSYNKCVQAYHFLENAVIETDHSIEQTRDQEMKDLEKMQKELDDAKNALNDKVEQTKNDITCICLGGYDEALRKWETEAGQSIDREELDSLLSERNTIVRESVGYNQIRRQVEEDRNTLQENLERNKEELSDGPMGRKKVQQFGNLLSDLGKDAVRSLGSWSKEKQTIRNVHAQVSDEVTQKTNEIVNNMSARAQKNIEEKSAAYWEHESEDLKQGLAEVVTGSETLDENTRKNLQTFILQYQSADYKQIPVEPFNTDEFKNPFNQKLDVDKMVSRYTERLKDTMEEASSKISELHSGQFEAWADTFVTSVQKHITEYSPDLRSRSEEIKEEVQKIEKLESMRDALMKYKGDIAAMLNWKTVDSPDTEKAAED